jgi:hypothetical protein
MSRKRQPRIGAIAFDENGYLGLITQEAETFTQAGGGQHTVWRGIHLENHMEVDHGTFKSSIFIGTTWESSSPLVVGYTSDYKFPNKQE